MTTTDATECRKAACAEGQPMLEHLQTAHDWETGPELATNGPEWGASAARPLRPEAANLDLRTLTDRTSEQVPFDSFTDWLQIEIIRLDNLLESEQAQDLRNEVFQDLKEKLDRHLVAWDLVLEHDRQMGAQNALHSSHALI